MVQLEELQGFWFLYKLENGITFNTTKEDQRAFADFILRVGELTLGAEDPGPSPPPSAHKHHWDFGGVLVPPTSAAPWTS